MPANTMFASTITCAKPPLKWPTIVRANVHILVANPKALNRLPAKMKNGTDSKATLLTPFNMNWGSIARSRSMSMSGGRVDSPMAIDTGMRKNKKATKTTTISRESIERLSVSSLGVRGGSLILGRFATTIKQLGSLGAEALERHQQADDRANHRGQSNIALMKWKQHVGYA